MKKKKKSALNNELRESIRFRKIRYSPAWTHCIESARIRYNKRHHSNSVPDQIRKYQQEKKLRLRSQDSDFQERSHRPNPDAFQPKQLLDSAGPDHTHRHLDIDESAYSGIQKKDFPEGKVLIPYSSIKSFLSHQFNIVDKGIINSVFNYINSNHLKDITKDNRKCLSEGKYFSCENVLPGKLTGAVNFVIWINSGYKMILHDSDLADIRQDLLLYFYRNKKNLVRLYRRVIRKRRKAGKRFFSLRTFLIHKFRKVFQRSINQYLYAVHVPYRLQEELKKANLVLMESARVSNSTHEEFTKIVEEYQRDTYRHLSMDTVFHIAALKNFRKRLSRIEQQMIDMRLDGHEISCIASKLGKSSGYIRNLNSGIHRKLSRYEQQ